MGRFVKWNDPNGRQLRLEEEVNYPTLAKETRMGHPPSRIPAAEGLLLHDGLEVGLYDLIVNSCSIPAPT